MGAHRRLDVVEVDQELPDVRRLGRAVELLQAPRYPGQVPAKDLVPAAQGKSRASLPFAVGVVVRDDALALGAHVPLPQFAQFVGDDAAYALHRAAVCCGQFE
jgi:hypothetical protein